MQRKNLTSYNGKRSFNDVLRKRLVIELITSPALLPFTRTLLETYLVGLSQVLHMTIINGPLVHSWAKDFRPGVYDGYEGLIMWAESGAQLYTWERFRAITVDIFTCKEFSVQEAVDYTRRTLAAEQIAWEEIGRILTVAPTSAEQPDVVASAAE
jgi:S-adenosylmethionine/arginine decarboxylase-like enzyme